MSRADEPPPSSNDRPWESVSEALAGEAAAGVQAAEVLDLLSAEDSRLALSRLTPDERSALFKALDPSAAAEVLRRVPEEQGADILEEIPAEVAADIVEQLPDAVSADLLQEMDSADSEALLAEIEDASEAETLRELSAYDWDTAGGLMSDVFAAFSEALTVGGVLEELGARSQELGEMDIQYVYVVDKEQRLRGVLPLRDVVLARRDAAVRDVMIADPVSVKVADKFESLLALFEERTYLGLPVVDEERRLVGVVTRQALREATTDHLTEDYLHVSGIVGGEELRSMPMLQRCRRRLAWLAPNIGLNIVAASVIAMHEDTLEAVIALAVFLPIVSDMSGCSGNQAVAVSIRELTLGLIRPHEYLRILWKEGVVGVVNGSVLGAILGTIAGLWKDNLWLGLVVGGALALNTLLSVLLGGSVPLLLKRLRVDPALASGPILTTCTDMCGFFLVLSLASAMLSRLI